MPPWTKPTARRSPKSAASFPRLSASPELPPALADAKMRELALACGAEGLQKLWAAQVDEEVERLRAEGWTVDEHRQVVVLTVLGPTEAQSPRLRHRGRRGAVCRPTRERLGLSGKQRTAALERVLVDFGAEEAFGPAAKRVQEHYGFDIGRTTVLRVVEQHARQAEAFVSDRLAEAGQAYDQPVRDRPGEAEMLLGLDGSMVRTGTLESMQASETTPVRGLPKRRRAEAWREVRVGLCRPLHEVEPTCVAAMTGYTEIVHQLFQAAVSRGLSSRTQAVAVADGGNGLREEIEAQFLKSDFVLDQFHVIEHLAETADAMGLSGDGGVA